tara:strand:- start:261 stop:476 length:216 start_codon:yes stop_codon:yes gene_type:complete
MARKLEGLKRKLKRKNKESMMPAIIAWLTKTILTEAMLKELLVVLGDYLVGSSKNKLDDKLWKQVKKILAK